MPLGPPQASEDVRHALALTREGSAQDRTVDITTIGRRSGEARRIEIWFYREGDENYLSGSPGRRAWANNLRAHPDFTFHLKHGVTADLPARAVVAGEEERRRFFTSLLEELNQPSNPAGITQPAHLEDWMAGSPLFRIEWL